MATEFRVTWRRTDRKVKHRIYSKRSSAERFMGLFGDEPWLYYRGNPDALYCCDGVECGCGGLTIREAAESDRANMPPLEYLRLEERTVGEWAEVSRG